MIGPARYGAARAAAAAVAMAVALAGGTAHADDKVKAIALFDEGQKEMKAGNYAKACKAFEASIRLVPDSGTRGSLARCYTQQGKIASAWTLWRELSDTAPTPALRKDAAAQVKKLEPRLARYTVKVASAPAGLTVKVDGADVDLSLDVPVPIDPGTYAVEASAPGRVAWKGELTADEGKTVEIAVPPLAAPTPASGTGTGTGTKTKTGTGTGTGVGSKSGPGSGTDDPSKRPSTGGKPGRGRRLFGLALTGAGIGGLVVGGVFGAQARSHNEKAKVICGGDIDRCEPSGTNDAQREVDRARSAARISTVAFIAGGAVALTGIIVFVTAPSGERRTVAVTPLVDGTTAGLSLSGRY